MSAGFGPASGPSVVSGELPLFAPAAPLAVAAAFSDFLFRKCRKLGINSGSQGRGASLKYADWTHSTAVARLPVEDDVGYAFIHSGALSIHTEAKYKVWRRISFSIPPYSQFSCINYQLLSCFENLRGI